MASEETIYVFLNNEGVNVWRPVKALKLESSLYQILRIQDIPVDEEWEFKAGDVVRCEERKFEGGESGLVAVEIAR